MEREVPRAGAGRCRERPGSAKLAGHPIERPDDHDIETEIRRNGKVARRIGLDHVGMRRVVSAPGETARRRVRRGGGAERAGTGRTRVGVRLHIRRRSEPATGEDRQDREISAAVVRHQDVGAGGVHAQVGRSPAFGADRVQERELAISPVDGERADRAGRCVVEIADSIGDIEMGLARTERQPGGVGCGHAGGRRTWRRKDLDRPEIAVGFHAEQVNPKTIRCVAADVGKVLGPASMRAPATGPEAAKAAAPASVPVSKSRREMSPRDARRGARFFGDICSSLSWSDTSGPTPVS